ncbi:unnamed protein product [Anisakis simplex]|uniref:G_PROTEIN_RECEP_F1_2 domain-containing protein n=1 Tax=Anisakis simplex TaxID=6269 RepID=A0A0M3K568_ANISI|nr:unnamed protein product [Anisakis simplex]
MLFCYAGTVFGSQKMNETSDVQPLTRLSIDTVEIAFLSVIIVFGTLLNIIRFMQIIRHSRTPTAKTNFLSGPYQISSFTLFQLNLCITDFAILLVHALGKVVWLFTYEWPFGEASCKIYQFLSAFTYYSNSNVVVAIGIDRLKVVYTSHIQGATSVRRVRYMLLIAWIIACICSAPQFYVWTTIEVTADWMQCSTIWEIATHQGRSSAAFERLQMIYELIHQALVVWLPSLLLSLSYVLIVIRILHYTCRPGLHTSQSNVRHRQPSAPPLRMERISLDKGQLLCAEIKECSIRRSRSGPSTSLDYIRDNLKYKSGDWYDALRSSSATGQRWRSPTINCADLFMRRRQPSLPFWQHQLRSKVFVISLTIIAAHITLWLPYNIISTSRFISYDFFTWACDNGGHLLEDLIIVNSLINPIIYGCAT